MRRATVNFILNLVSFLILLGLGVTGLIIALPHRHGPNEVKPLGIGRGEWGDIHLWLGIAFVVLMVVHIILHWGWVVCYVKSLFGIAEKPTCDNDPTK
jgi:predicted ferric reductase